jgi:hypothetical protein
MTMEEIQHVALGMGINYNGIFNYNDLIAFINAYFKKKGYNRKVMDHTEKRKKTHRNISFRFRPYRMVKATMLEVQVWLNINNMKDVVKTIDNMKVNLNQGNIDITIDCFIRTSVRGTFDARPEYIFIKTIFDKFLFKAKGKDTQGMVKNDATELKEELQSFLNLNKFLF